MGEVYKAQDPYLPRFVAIKILRPELASQDSFVDRFLREAAVAATLNHPNIVTLHGVEQFDGTWRIVMEYVQGTSLARLISRFGKQKPRYALEIIRHAAHALICAHGQHVIHRDIKPHNILLSDQGVVKITDFGLAKVLYEDSELTKIGEVVGTPRYMSPEQVNGEPLTFHTDIYSLGVVLYELIAGKSVYDVSDPLVIMRRIVDEPFPDVREVVPHIKPQIAKIIAKMTAKNPSQRYPDARALAQELLEFRETGRTPTADGMELSEITETPIPRHEPVLEDAAADKPDEILLHHSTLDEEQARWVTRELESSGFKVRRCLRGDADSDHEILRVLESKPVRSRVLPLISSAYLENNEMVPLIQLRLSEDSSILRPVVIGNLSGHGSNWLSHCLDISSLPEPEAKRSLISWATQGISARETAIEVLRPSGTGTRIVRLPQRRTLMFSGRTAQLQELKNRLRELSAVALCPSCPGGAGLGVSSMALEFARVNEADYSHIWWIRAHNTESLSSDYSSVCDGLGLPESASRNRPARSKAAKRWLTSNKGWLVIFDGVRNPKRISSLLPERINGHAIIVSSSSRWPESRGRIQVPPLGQTEALEYLGRRARQHPNKAASRIVDLLENSPLSLRLAGAYCDTRKISFHEYLDHFLERHSILWAGRDNDLPIRAAAMTAFSLSLEQLLSESEAAYDLLNVCSYCCADAIPIDLIRSHPAIVCGFSDNDPDREREIEAAFECLIRLGILEGPIEDAFMHELLQEFLIAWNEFAPTDEASAARRAVLQSLSGHDLSHVQTDYLVRGLRFALDLLRANPCSEKQARDLERVLPHARTLLRHAERRNIGAAERGEAWTQIARHQAALSDYHSALRAYQSALTTQERFLGKRHMAVSTIYRELAEIHRKQSELNSALGCYESALEIERIIQSKPNKDRAVVYRSLGDIYRALDESNKARSSYEEALCIDRGLDGDHSADVGLDYILLGEVLESCGLFAAAWEHYTRALESYERVYGDRHESVGEVVRKLATLHQKMGDLVEARHFYRRSLAIHMGLSGEMHPLVASDYENIGLVEVALGMPTAARENYGKALAINRALFGEGDLRVAKLNRRIAETHQVQGQLQEALRVYSTALPVFLRIAGPEDEGARFISEQIAAIRIELGIASA